MRPTKRSAVSRNNVLRNPAEHDVTAQFKFPLPSASSMYDDLTITLNGTNELDALQVEKGALVLEEDLAQGETANLQISFKSRGLAYWYFQIRQPREVRDFELLLNLPDLPKSKLNYPEGCMTPTEIKTNGRRARMHAGVSSRPRDLQ